MPEKDIVHHHDPEVWNKKREQCYYLKYHLKYDVGLFTKSNIRRVNDPQPPGDETMATDAIFVGSLLYPPDGSFSSFWYTKDGRNNGEPLKDSEVLKFIAGVIQRLSESIDGSLNDDEMNFVSTVSQMYRRVTYGNGTEDMRKSMIALAGSFEPNSN